MIVAVPARAKLNLDLEVLGRRADGYHDIRTTMQTIALHDVLEVSSAQKTSLTTSGLPAPHGPANMVLQAHAALEKASSRELPAQFQLDKRVPAGAGMGGASSDAAAALRALASMFGLKIDLAPIAASLGADVSFFLTGGTALAEGRGEKLTALTDASAWFAIAWPGIELPTANVYKAWDEVGGDLPNQLRRAAGRVEPSLEEFAKKLGEAWQMTGSGSAFFLRCKDEAEARHAINGLDCWKTVTRAIGRWA